MSATDKTATDFEVGAVAHVNFRVRCDKLSHGEEIFLVAESDQGMQKVRLRFLSREMLNRVVYNLFVESLF